MAPIVVGLSGPTCSGKTTLARYLQRIFPRLAILHEDDFYRPATDLPYRAGFQNWDCAASIDQDRLLKVLDHVRSKGTLPPEFTSYQTPEEPTGAKSALVEELQHDVREWMTRRCPSTRVWEDGLKQEQESPLDVVLVDGFLLFGKSMAKLKEAFDLRILLRGRYEEIKQRRDGRTGYNTAEGFWKDPEGFFDQVVWPEYVEEHGFFFVGQKVDASVDDGVARKEGIHICPEENIEDMLKWATETLLSSLAGLQG